MPSSNSEARARLALLALLSLPAWACATAIDNAPADTSPLASSGDSGNPSAGSSGSASAGAGSSAGKGGATGAAGSGASGAPQSGGAPSSAGSGGAGKGGTSAGGSSSAGKGGTSGGGGSSAGKGGTAGSSTGGAGKGGSSSAGSSSAGSSSAGSSAGGASSGGTTGGTGCDAAHAVATITTQQVYTGKANACVRLAVNPTWAMIALKFQPMPGTAAYPVPFSFFSCAGNGTGSLTGDYVENTFKTGTNPGCDFFVQFGGGATTIKVTYYD